MHIHESVAGWTTISFDDEEKAKDLYDLLNSRIKSRYRGYIAGSYEVEFSTFELIEFLWKLSDVESHAG